MEKGRLPTAFLFAVPVLAAVAVFGLLQNAASASAPYMIGLDMRPNASSTSSSSADTCVEVDEGDEFAIDIFVTNADSLTAWELRVDYDPEVVSLESADYDYLLTASGGGVFPSLFEKELEGRYFLAAAETRNPDSGSGVLARLTLTALEKGTSAISITSSPNFYRPRLTGASGAISDSNGDGLWDGDLTGGKVAVDQRCTGSTPVKTPPPGTPGPTKTPKPGETPAPTDEPGTGGQTATPAPGSPGEGGGQNPGGEPSPFVGNVTGNDEPGGAGNDGDPGSADDPGNDGDGSNPGSGLSDEDGQDGDNLPGGVSPSSSESGSASLVMLIAGIFAAICIVVGAAFVLFRRRTPY